MMMMGDRERTLRANPGSHLKAPPLPDSYTFNPVLADQKWADFDLDSFSDVLQCDAIAYENRPIHDASTWRQLRSTYEDVVGPERSSIALASRGLDTESSFTTPFAAEESTLLRVEEIPGKGRGLVASRDIKKGEHLWSDVYLGEFFLSSCLHTCIIYIQSFQRKKLSNSLVVCLFLILYYICHHRRYTRLLLHRSRR